MKADNQDGASTALAGCGVVSDGYFTRYMVALRPLELGQSSIASIRGDAAKVGAKLSTAKGEAPHDKA